MKISELDPKEIEYMSTLEWEPLMVYLEKKHGIELKEEFVTISDAREILCISRQTINNNKKMFGKIVIGRSTLVRKSAIQEYIQNGGRWKRNLSSG